MPSFDKGLIEQIISAITPEKSPVLIEGQRIKVHAAVSRFAVLYERIRNAVDYKDDHLLRRAAIQRILKRQLILESDPQSVAEQLIRELIGARYLANGELPETVYAEVALLIKKYLSVESTRAGSKRQFIWLRSILAVEIEEALVDATSDKALVTFLYERIVERIKVTGVNVSDADVRMQAYLACYRTLLKVEDNVLAFKLLRAYVPEWLRATDWLDYPRPVAERLVEAEQRIKASLVYPLALKFQRTVKPWAVALIVLRDVLTEKNVQVCALIEKPEALRREVARLSERHYNAAKTRLRRGAMRAIIYLFLTKMILALVLEIPLEHIWYKEVALPALLVNLLFPPCLMFLVALFIRVPDKANTLRLQTMVEGLLSSEPLPLKEIRISKQRSLLGGVLFGLIYMATFAVVFGTVGFVLMVLKFTWVSAAIFIFFLCLVSFFAFRLRQNSREMVIVESKESLRSVFIDLLSIPILRAGHWLSRSISRLNVFLFFFDFLFEAPFKLFLTVLEEWLAYLQEKKEELQ